MKVISAATVSAFDERAKLELGVPGRTLMMRAGRAAAEEIIGYINRMGWAHVKRVVILCGKGNNGGDGVVVASVLALRGIAVHIYALCGMGEWASDAAWHGKRLSKEITLEIRQNLAPELLRAGDLVIDALLGTGTRGFPQEPIAGWIRTVNSSGLPVVALDVPSGLDPETGVSELAIEADLTITFAAPKPGLLLGEGPEHCGRIRVMDLGFPGEWLTEASGCGLDLTMEEDVRKLLPRLSHHAHKGTNGRVLVVAGSEDYAGAAVLSANSALRSGAGMVILAVPRGAELRGLCSAVVVRRLPSDAEGLFDLTAYEELADLRRWPDVVVIGPGLGIGKGPAKLVQHILEGDLECRRIVLDADGINCWARHAEFTLRKDLQLIITPHEGECRRVLTRLNIPIDPIPTEISSRTWVARQVAECAGAVCLLKGPRTIIADIDGLSAVNGSGSPGLATAGSGDVLSGLLGALWAHGMSSFDAARSAAFIHGMAAELSPVGHRGLVADDLPELIAVAMRQISPFA